MVLVPSGIIVTNEIYPREATKTWNDIHWAIRLFLINETELPPLLLIDSVERHRDNCVLSIHQFLSVWLQELYFNKNRQLTMSFYEECTRGVRKIHNMMRNTRTVGEKQHLEAALRHIRSLRNQFKSQQKS
ncbi:unnamed protein product [Ceutorhynchus assimilis]|uniref:Uncharacterized protein n=1 Tax=Ceutorhynchus assimilis TaxID=467358 RepID=A0A9N9QNP1_9CUCU|nr:unnamed protein product [Ceutorhynchus assimilis]